MLTQCANCGKFFGADRPEQKFCSACHEQHAGPDTKSDDYEQKKFENARKLVYEFPDISPDDLVERMEEIGFEITRKEIMGYVKDGRLTLKSVEMGQFCEDCGRKILSGRLCPKCSASLEKAIQNRNQPVEMNTREISGGSERKQNVMHTKSKV